MLRNLNYQFLMKKYFFKQLKISYEAEIYIITIFKEISMKINLHYLNNILKHPSSRLHCIGTSLFLKRRICMKSLKILFFFREFWLFINVGYEVTKYRVCTIFCSTKYYLYRKLSKFQGFFLKNNFLFFNFKYLYKFWVRQMQLLGPLEFVIQYWI